MAFENCHGSGPFLTLDSTLIKDYPIGVLTMNGTFTAVTNVTYQQMPIIGNVDYTLITNENTRTVYLTDETKRM